MIGHFLGKNMTSIETLAYQAKYSARGLCCLAPIHTNFDHSNKLPTFRSVFTRASWQRHIELILDCVHDELLDQDNMTTEEYAAAYNLAKYR